MIFLTLLFPSESARRLIWRVIGDRYQKCISDVDCFWLFVIHSTLRSRSRCLSSHLRGTRRCQSSGRLHSLRCRTRERPIDSSNCTSCAYSAPPDKLIHTTVTAVFTKRGVPPWNWDQDNSVIYSFEQSMVLRLCVCGHSPLISLVLRRTGKNSVAAPGISRIVNLFTHDFFGLWPHVCLLAWSRREHLSRCNGCL